MMMETFESTEFIDGGRVGALWCGSFRLCVCVGRGGGGVGGAHSTSPICREIRTHTGYL